MSRPEYRHNIEHKGDCTSCNRSTTKRIKFVLSPNNRQYENTDHYICKNCLGKHGTNTELGDFIHKRLHLKDFISST
jgi:hypothetical protein